MQRPPQVRQCLIWQALGTDRQATESLSEPDSPGCPQPAGSPAPPSTALQSRATSTATPSYTTCCITGTHASAVVSVVKVHNPTGQMPPSTCCTADDGVAQATRAAGSHTPKYLVQQPLYTMYSLAGQNSNKQSILPLRRHQNDNSAAAHVQALNTTLHRQISPGYFVCTVVESMACRACTMRLKLGLLLGAPVQQRLARATNHDGALSGNCGRTPSPMMV